MILTLNDREVTSLCTELTLHESILAVSKTLTATFAFENFNGYVPVIYGNCGDNLKLFQGAFLIFEGTIMKSEVFGNQSCFMVTAYEKGHKICLCDVYGFFRGTAKSNSQKAISSLGFTFNCGVDFPTKPFISRGGITAYEVIKKGYSSGFFTYCKGDVINVEPLGNRKISLDNVTLLEIKSKTSAINMVNKVSLTNSKGAIIHNTQSNLLVNKYGQYHKYYQITKNDDKNAISKDKLKGEFTSGKIVIQGSFNLYSGMGLDIDLKRFGLWGSYIIKDVTHKIKGGVHLTEIGIFKEVI